MLCIRYHVPRDWLNPGENLLVVFEEIGGDPRNITIDIGPDDNESHVLATSA
jgi:hypothetical protein